MNEHKPFLAAFFRMLIDAPRITIGLGMMLILVSSFGLTRLYKDTSVDAFIPADHPSLLANDRTAEIFGLTEPIAIAVMSRDGRTIFNSEALALIAMLTEAVEQLPNVRSDKVISLATESSIRGDEGSLLVEAYYEPGMSELEARDARARWLDMPPHVNSLVAEDESGAVIMAELIDAEASAGTYEAVRELVGAHGSPDYELLVAGPGAVSGYLSSYIDRDARVLQPVVFVLILVFLYVAFRSVRALAGPLLVVAGAAGGALGIMAWQDIAYFAITNALPVILVAISVADAIHVLSGYYRLRAGRPHMPRREVIVLTMTEMSRPITLTTLTTMAGFVGIGLASIMPPIEYFAWFAALGVALAWLFSMVVLPPAMMVLNLRPSKAFSSWSADRPDYLGALFGRIGLLSVRHSGLVLGVFVILLVMAAVGASQLRVDRSQVENFAPDEPIRIADERINRTFAGTAFLDVIVETGAEGDLLESGRMSRIAELQTFMDGLPHVSKTLSIVDYLSLLHRAFEMLPSGEARLLPHPEGALAQYMLVYEAAGDPTDFEEEIAPDYRTALLRAVLDTPLYSESVPAVERLSEYLSRHLDDRHLRGTIAGDVNVAYHWMSRLETSHFTGVGLSLILVLLMSMIAFRSMGAGVVSVVPVAFTVLLLYGVMGYLGIYLEPATSMFAAISVGVGVDFAIHLVDRLRLALRQNDGDHEAAVRQAMPGTARACFFNAAALGVGFSVLLLSGLPTLQRFGGLVSIAALGSFLCALFIVPALYAAAHQLTRSLAARAGGTAAVLLLMLAGAGFPERAAAVEPLSGLEVAQRVAEREEGQAARRTIRMTLTDRRGRVREREAVVLKYSTEQSRATRISYQAPKSVRGVTFLSRDAKDVGREERWLYLPATRKARRIPASDRGDYFLGTDFTYEDVQSDLKFDVDDYRFEYVSGQRRDGAEVHEIQGRPVTPAAARELGYGRFEARVDGESWMPMEIRFFDLKGALLKTIFVRDVRRVDAIWTAHEVEAVNHQTGHSTRFDYHSVAYPDTLPPDYFDAARLDRMNVVGSP